MNATMYLMRGEHREELEQFARVRGWHVIDTFVDDGRRRDRRPGFRALLAAARERRFDVVLVYRCSAFARTLDELMRVLAQLQQHDVKFVSATEPFEQMSFNGFVAALATFQRDVIGARTRDGLRLRRRRGGHVGRPRVGVDDTILAMRRTGKPLRAIARELEVGYGTVQRALARAAG